MVAESGNPAPRRTDPFQPDELQFMDQGASHWRLTLRSPAWRPPADMYETEETLVVRVEVAGMREEDFEIELDGRLLTIHGVRPDQPGRRAYHQMEIRFGEFQIELELPVPVLASEATATYKSGFLRLEFPKSRPQTVSIDADS